AFAAPVKGRGQEVAGRSGRGEGREDLERSFVIAFRIQDTASLIEEIRDAGALRIRRYEGVYRGFGRGLVADGKVGEDGPIGGFGSFRRSLGIRHHLSEEVEG